MEVMEEINEMQNYVAYSIIRPIGKGAFGEVFEAEHKSLKSKVAIKRTKIKHMNKFHKELFSLNRLSHPNIISLIYAFVTKFSLYMVMELAPGCDLNKYLTRNDMKLQENTCRIIGRQLASAVCYMHCERIAHRDIKPDNIMIDETIMKIKLVDFGLSGTVDNGKLLTSFGGTSGYIAPEIYRKQPYDERADMWGIGITFYVMITGILPDFIHLEDGKISENIERIIRIYFLAEEIKNSSEHFKNMLISLLQPEPSKRMDSRRLSEHPWITKNFEEPIRTHGYETLPALNRFKIYKQLALLTKSTVAQTVNTLETDPQGNLSAMYSILRKPELEKLYIQNCNKKPDQQRAHDDCSESLRGRRQKRALEDYGASSTKQLRRYSVDAAIFHY